MRGSRGPCHQKNPLDSDSQAREKAKQLLIQSERAARERSPLERTRAGLQQRITEDQAKYARASATLGHNQLIPPTRCSYETRE